MPLTKQDLTDIRYVILEALDVAVAPRLDLLENQMEGLNRRMDGLDGRISSLESIQLETGRRLSFVETELTKLDGSVTALHNDVVELYGMVR